MGDGCLMEGSHLSRSLSSQQVRWNLGKLVAFLGMTTASLSMAMEGWLPLLITPKRFEAYGWLPAVDGHDADAINAAIESS